MENGIGIGIEFNGIWTVGQLIDALEHYDPDQIICHKKTQPGGDTFGPVSLSIGTDFDPAILVIEQ